jgi:malic enzyme
MSRFRCIVCSTGAAVLAAGSLGAITTWALMGGPKVLLFAASVGCIALASWCRKP